MRQADPKEVGEYIHSCGFYNGKSKDLVACAQQLLERFGGKVPDNMEDLTSLPGVGRKTANLILGDVYGQPSYVCDTHCIRITGRLGITDGSKDPVKVEQQLRKAIPPEESGLFLPPDGAFRPGRVHRPVAEMRRMSPKSGLRSGKKLK